MYRILSSDLAHVLLEDVEFIAERDTVLSGTWSILCFQEAGSKSEPRRFLAIRQTRHAGFTVWSTRGGGRLIGYCDNPINACDEILRYVS